MSQPKEGLASGLIKLFFSARLRRVSISQFFQAVNVSSSLFTLKEGRPLKYYSEGQRWDYPPYAIVPLSETCSLRTLSCSLTILSLPTSSAA